jgi:SAM-dependent methyltransferase
MDFGCGSKPYKALFTNVSAYIGVDYDGEGHSHAGEEIDVFYDGHHLPFKDGEFDSIFSSEVMEHIFNLEEILQELNRVLRPGGKMLITLPFAWHEHEMPNDFGRYTSLGLTALLERHGFRVVSLEKTTGFVETLFQLWGLYWYMHIIPKIRIIGRVFAPTFHFVNNNMARLFRRVMPVKTDYFLNLVVLVEKV